MQQKLLWNKSSLRSYGRWSMKGIWNGLFVSERCFILRKVIKLVAPLLFLWIFYIQSTLWFIAKVIVRGGWANQYLIIGLAVASHKPYCLPWFQKVIWKSRGWAQLKQILEGIPSPTHPTDGWRRVMIPLWYLCSVSERQFSHIFSLFPPALF